MRLDRARSSTASELELFHDKVGCGLVVESWVVVVGRLVGTGSRTAERVGRGAVALDLAGPRAAAGSVGAWVDADAGAGSLVVGVALGP